eukprot:TRINITY_DN5710_c0_g1_i1.p1 TRINITY_DN5710_c0_g1~~TRINITY_DN5710_c0_g1_i1.p1  ORF type:complete len:1048 (-),score=215.60 TRINITY_DN5710_c0_g1_i1:336-3479(-)
MTQIDRDFPEEHQDMDPIELENNSQKQFLEEKINIYLDRPEYNIAIDNHVFNKREKPYYIIGGTGIGKTSLLCKWISDYSKNYPDDILIYEFIGHLHNHLHKSIYRIIYHIKKNTGTSHEIPTDPNDIVHSLSEWLTIADSYNRRLVLIIDGVDQIEPEYQGLGWIPKVIPKNIRLIISSTDSGRSYDNIYKGETENNILWIEPLDDRGKRTLIEMYLLDIGKKLSNSQILDLVNSQSSGTPLYLCSILDQLKVFADFDRLNECLFEYIRVPDIQSLIGTILTNWEKEFNDKNFLKDVLSLLWVSRGGLLEHELMSILSGSPQIMWSSLYEGLGELLIHTNENVNIGHQILRDIVSARYLSERNIKDKYRNMIIAYFSCKGISNRKITEYPFQLRKVGHVDKIELQRFLTDLTVFDMLYSPFTKFDLFKYWKLASDITVASQIYSEEYLLNTPDMLPSDRFDLALKLSKFMIETGSANYAVFLLEECLKNSKIIYGEKSLEVSNVHYLFTELYMQMANYSLSEKHIGESFQLRLELYGRNHVKVADVLWMKALIKKKQSNYEQAIELYEEALDIVKRNYGSYHASVGIYLKTMADVYRKLAEFKKAEDLYFDAMDIFKIVYGDVHPEYAYCLDCLGRIYKKQGIYDKAEPLYYQALGILEGVYGRNHLKVAETCLNLGDVKRKLAQFDDASEMYFRALEINNSQLGALHPDTAENFASIGRTMKEQGKLNDAIVYLQQAVDVVSNVFNNGHIKVAEYTNILADCHALKANYDIALEYYHKALDINKRTYGDIHPEVSENLNAIGLICKKRGNYRDALGYYVQCLHIIEKVYGKDHPKYALYMHNLGVINRKLGDLDEAWKCYMCALEANKGNYGEKHPLVAQNMNGLGMVLKKKGEDLDKAANYHLQALSIMEELHGNNHERVAITLNCLAEVYRKQGKFDYDGAEKIYNRALRINRHLFGEEHPEVAENLNGLAQVYKNQQNYRKAEPVLLKAIEITKNTIGETHPHTINRYHNLADLYERWGRVEDSVNITNIVNELKKKRNDNK